MPSSTSPGAGPPTDRIASLLKLAGTAFGPQHVSDTDRPALEALYQGALAAGLPAVSASTRSHIVRDWSRLRMQDLALAASDEARQAAVAQLLRHVHLVPYREDKARILASVPESSFAALEPSAQRSLMVALFDPLDAHSRIEFLKGLAESGQPAKAAACLARFTADLEHPLPGEQKLLHPHRLSGQARIDDQPPHPLEADESARIEERLRAMPLARRP